MNILKINVTDGTKDEEFLEFFCGKVDNSMIELSDNAVFTGDIILLKVFKNEETTLDASIRNDVVYITALDDKDDRISIKMINGLVNGDYETFIINKTLSKVIIVLIPSEIL